MGKVLVSLWLLGATLYTVNTIIIVDAVNLLGGGEDKTLTAAQNPISDRTAKPESSSPAPANLAQRNSSKTVPPKVAAPDNQVAPEVVESKKSETDETNTETNTSVATEQTVAKPEIAATEESRPAIEPPDSNVAQDSTERVTVTRAVNMRAGPTTSAPTLTVQQAGTELQVLGEDGGWIQVINPDTQQAGWIYSRYLNPMTSDQAGRSYAAKPSERERAARVERRRYATIDPEPGEEAFGYVPYRRYNPYGRLERRERYGWTAEPRRRGEIFEFFFDDYPGPRW